MTTPKDLIDQHWEKRASKLSKGLGVAAGFAAAGAGHRTYMKGVHSQSAEALRSQGFLRRTVQPFAAGAASGALGLGVGAATDRAVSTAQKKYKSHFKDTMKSKGVDPENMGSADKKKLKGAFKSVDKKWNAKNEPGKDGKTASIKVPKWFKGTDKERRQVEASLREGSIGHGDLSGSKNDGRVKAQVFPHPKAPKETPHSIMGKKASSLHRAAASLHPHEARLLAGALGAAGGAGLGAAAAGKGKRKKGAVVGGVAGGAAGLASGDAIRKSLRSGGVLSGTLPVNMTHTWNSAKGNKSVITGSPSWRAGLTPQEIKDISEKAGIGTWKGASAYEEAALRRHVKEAYAANGVLPPAFEEAFIVLEKRAGIGDMAASAVKGVKRMGAGIRGAGLKMQAGAAGPQGLMGHLQRGVGKAVSTVGRTVQKNPGAALATGAAGAVGTAGAAGLVANRMASRKEQ